MEVQVESSPRGAGTTRSSGHGQLLSLRWLWLPLAIYAATRVIAIGFIDWASRYQGRTDAIPSDSSPEVYFVHTPLPPDPGYLGVATNWDGQWYNFIATLGYQPNSVDASWQAGWAWAFPPVYPKLVSLVMGGTGWDFPVCAVIVSLLLGAVAVVLLYRLAEPRVGALGAAGLVAITCCFPSAPLLQVAYSESAALLLVAWSLLLLSKKQYWWALVPLVVLSFTRLITPALGIALLFHIWTRVQGSEKLTRNEMAGAGAYFAVSISGVAWWSVMAGVLGGGVGASRAESMATGYDGGYVGYFWAVSPVLGGAAVILGVAWLRFILGHWRAWGPELTAWAAGYPIFIVMVTPPTTGLMRYLLLAFPLGLILLGGSGIPTTWRVVRLTLACGMLLVLQLLWVRYSLVVPDLGLTLMP